MSSGGGGGDHPPGWNDPPTFSYVRTDDVADDNNKRSQGGRAKFNQRIAFPLSTAVTSSSSATTSTASTAVGPPPKGPPLTPGTARDASSKGSEPSSVSSSPEIRDSEAAFGSLSTLLLSLSESPSLSATRRADIERRLQVMRDKWNKGALNEKLKKGLDDLISLLEEQQYDKADKLHVALTMDFPSECSPWMVGVKHLIVMLKSQVKGGQPPQVVGITQPLPQKDDQE